MKHPFLILFLLVFLFPLTLLAQTDEEWVLLFEKGESALSDAGKQKIDSLLLANPPQAHCMFDISGYADDRGKPDKNKRLTELRAKAVQEYLLQKGIPEKNITATGKGIILDPEKNQTEDTRRLNRRAVIQLNCAEPDTELPAPTPAAETSDTVVTGAQGTRVIFDKRAFAGMDMKQLDIRITEMFSYCDSIPEDLMTATTTGVCLQSGGMAMLEVFYKKKSKRDLRQSFTVMIPVNNNDTSFRFYVSRRIGGQIRFQEAKGKIVNENGRMYYQFKTNQLGTFNADRPIVGCNIDQGSYYRLKIWPAWGKVRIYLKNGFGFMQAVRYRRRGYRIPDTLAPDELWVQAQGIRYILHAWSDYITTRPYVLSELPHTRKGTYRLKKKHFTPAPKKAGMPKIGNCP